MINSATRFWAKVDKTPTCWNWTASTICGYGHFYESPTRTLHKLTVVNLKANGRK